MLDTFPFCLNDRFYLYQIIQMLEIQKLANLLISQLFIGKCNSPICIMDRIIPISI